MEQDKAKALKEGNAAEAERIQKVIDAKKNMATFAQANLDAEQATAVMESIATNGKTVYTENNAKLLMNGIKIDEMNDQANKGIDQTARLAGENAKAVERFQKNFGEMGYAAGKSSRELQQTFGIGNKARAAAAKFADLKTEEGQKQWYKEKAQLEAEQEAKKKEQEGEMATRAALESNERAARLAFDGLLKQLSGALMNLALKIMPHIVTALNFVSNNFDKIISISKGLAVAMGALAAAAVAGKIVNVFRNFGDSVKGLFGKKSGPVGSSSDNPMYVRTAGAAGALGDIIGGGGGGGGKGGGSMDKLSSVSSAGGKSSGFLMNVVRALAYSGRVAQYIVIGAGAIGVAIASIGAGIAAATWLTGAAMPNLAKGLKAFDKLNGPNLKQVGMGMAGLGAGILAMGAGEVAGAVGNIANFLVGGEDPIEKVTDQVFKLQKLDIDREKVENNSAALLAFSKAMASASMIGAGTSLVSVTTAIADGVSSFFSDKPPFQDFVDFSHLDINAKKTKNNATAFRYFSDAMATYKGLSSPIGAIGTALATAAAKFFAVKPPLEQFVYFSHLNIDPKKTNINAKAFVSFSNAMAQYKGGPGLLDTVSSLIGKGFNELFNQDGPIEAFAEFAKKDFGPKASQNAEAFYKYAQAAGIISGGSYTPGATGGGGGGGGGFGGAVQSGMEAGASLGAGAVGAVSGAVSAGASLIGKGLSAAKSFLTGKTPTSESDLKKAGLNIKQGDVQGDKFPLDNRMIEFAKNIQKDIPGFVRFTAFNDRYHHKLNYNSKHKEGKAVDFTLKRKPTREEGAKLVNMLKQGGAAHAIDEYNNPSGAATAGHIHAQFARNGGLFDGPDKGYPKSMKKLSSLDTQSIVMKLAKTSASTAVNENKKGKSKPSSVLHAQNSQLTLELARKLDQVIDALENDNSVQTKILKHSRA